MNNYLVCAALVLTGCATNGTPWRALNESRTANRLGYAKTNGVYDSKPYPVDSDLTEKGASALTVTWTVDGGLSLVPLGSISAHAERVADLKDITIRSGWPYFDNNVELISALGKRIVVEQRVAGDVEERNALSAEAQAQFKSIAHESGYKQTGDLKGNNLVIEERFACLRELNTGAQPHVIRPGESVKLPTVGTVTFGKWQEQVAQGGQADVVALHIPAAVGRVRVSYTGQQELKNHSAQPCFGIPAARDGFILIEHLGRYDLLDVSAQRSDGAITLTQRAFTLEVCP